MLEIKIWVLVGALAVTTTVIGFLGKAIAQSIINKMDELVTKIDTLLTTTTKLQSEVNTLQEQSRSLDHRLNQYSERLRTAEIQLGKLVRNDNK